MLGEAAVHADGVWKLQNDSTKEMTAQVGRPVCFVHGFCLGGVPFFPLFSGKIAYEGLEQIFGVLRSACFRHNPVLFGIF